MDCGAACLAMIARAYGKQYSIDFLRDECFITREGVSLLGITEAAKNIGFKCISAKLTEERLKSGEVQLPCILHWNQNHFVVLHTIKTKKFLFLHHKPLFQLADPAYGFITLSEDKFRKSWCTYGEKGIALFIQPTEKFFETEPPKQNKLTIKYILSYLTEFKLKVLSMFILLFIDINFSISTTEPN